MENRGEKISIKKNLTNERIFGLKGTGGRHQTFASFVSQGGVEAPLGSRGNQLDIQHAACRSGKGGGE